MKATFLALVTLLSIAAAPTTRNASPWGLPGPPEVRVSWIVIASPDLASANAGAVPFETRISLGSRLGDSLFIGGGCMPGPFPSPEPAMRALAEGTYAFEASSRKGDGGEVTWALLLADNALSGEITVTQPGNPMDRATIEAGEQREVDALEGRVQKDARGNVVNLGELNELERQIRIGRNAAVNRGRSLRFVIHTKRMVVSPTGRWPEAPPTQAATTRPSSPHLP